VNESVCLNPLVWAKTSVEVIDSDALKFPVRKAFFEYEKAPVDLTEPVASKTALER
jgi:hypothetical protein